MVFPARVRLLRHVCQEVSRTPPVQIVVQCSPYSHPSLDSERSPSLGPPRLPLKETPRVNKEKNKLTAHYLECHATGIARTVAPPSRAEDSEK